MIGDDVWGTGVYVGNVGSLRSLFKIFLILGVWLGQVPHALQGYISGSDPLYRYVVWPRQHIFHVTLMIYAKSFLLMMNTQLVGLSAYLIRIILNNGPWLL